jgi:hypothetical protein
MKKTLLLLVALSLGIFTETTFAQDFVLGKIKCKTYYKHLKECYGGKSGGGEASLSFWKNNISLDWTERDSAGYPVFRTSRVLYWNNSFRAFNSNALKNGHSDGVRTVVDIQDTYDLSFFKLLQGGCPNHYPIYDSWPDTFLITKDFFKDRYKYLVDCYDEKTGMDYIWSRNGRAHLYWGKDVIGIEWIMPLNDGWFVQNKRILHPESMEILNYWVYGDNSSGEIAYTVDDFVSNENDYNRGFYLILTDGCPISAAEYRMQTIMFED